MSATPRRVLVTGFGPFLEVMDNPAARLARAVDQAIVPDQDGDIEVIGRVIPVSYARGPQTTLDLARQLRVDAVLGVGVARGRLTVCVERYGRRAASPDHADIDGERRVELDPDGPDLVAATAPVEALARALGALVSDDAGGYVCNAWLYRVARAYEQGASPLRPLVAFVHVPDDGLAPERLLAALSVLWRVSSIAAEPNQPRPRTASASTS